MRASLLPALACPDCGGHPLGGDASGDPIQNGRLSCPQGHVIEVRNGVLWALRPTPDISSQLEENARERRGDLTAEEKEIYRRNISQIGCGTYNQLIRDNARAVLDEMAMPPGRSLDLGGGSGWLAAELAGRGFQAVTLDIEDPRERTRQFEAGAASRGFELVTDLAPELDRVSVDFVVADMHHLPFIDGAFDLVTMSAALHHAADPVATLREAARLLRPGGAVLCINEPVKGVFRNEAPILHGRGEEAGEHLYTAGAYLRFFRDAGLSPELHFPGWVDRRLSRREWEGVAYYRFLLPAVGAAWRLKPIRAAARGPLLRAGMDLFGLTLIAEARKG
jgi:SAM-dependent methyltransferase